MIELYTALTHAVEGSALIALGASLIWGVLSVILSPCHLSSIPLIIGFISDQGELTRRRAFVLSGLFGLGILVTIALIGAITAAMGRMMGDVGRVGNYAVAAVFFLVGLHLVGLIPLPFSGPGSVGLRKKGLLASLILGLVFGVALGPCTFAFMAPVLSVTLKAASTNQIYAAALLLFYGIGHCAVIVAAGTSAEAVQRYLKWNQKSRGADVVRRVCGVLVILGGIHLIRSTF